MDGRPKSIWYLFTLAFAALIIPSAGFAQPVKTESASVIRTEPEIRKHLNDWLMDEDDKVSESAAAVLSQLGPRDVPVLRKISSSGTICGRVAALRILMTRLDKGNNIYLPTVASLASGGSIFSSEKELLCRRGAAYLLSESGEGIGKMIRILRGTNVFAQRSVVFAFDDMTESEDYSNGRLDAMKEAIPIIAKSRQSRDPIVSGVANEVLSQIADYGPDELKALAKKYFGN